MENVSQDAGSVHSLKTSELDEMDNLPSVAIKMKNSVIGSINSEGSFMMFKQLFVPR